MVQIQYSSIGPDKWFGVDPATSLYLNQWWFAYWCIYASLGLNESTARFSFFPAMWPQWSHTLGSWIKHFIVCQFHTSSLIIFLHPTMLQSCSHFVLIWSHIYSNLCMSVLSVSITLFQSLSLEESFGSLDEITNIVTNICHQSNILLTANILKTLKNHHGWPE